MARPAAAPSPAPDLDLDGAWRRHGATLLGFAVNSLGDRALAEDCVQETFLRAWRSRERYDGRRASERTWLFAIARHVVVDAARARARRAVPVGDDGVTRLAPPTDGAQDAVDARVSLVAALAQLTPEHREVLVAVRLEGLTYAELAARNGVPVATLRTRTYHALRAMRALLAEEEDHD